MKTLLIITVILLSYTKMLCQISSGHTQSHGKDSGLHYYWPKYIDSLFKYKATVQSSSIIIVLTETSMFGNSIKTISLTNSQWTGKIVGVMAFKEDSQKKLNTSIDLNKILDTLINYGIFTLPDQKFLPLDSKWSVDDGMDYSISYKVGNLSRTYYFSNPDIYYSHEKNREVKELISYTSIVKVFDSLFTKN